MKVLLLSTYYLPGYKGGGPIKTIANLIGITSDKFDYKVITSDRDLGDECPYSNVSIGQWNSIENYSVFYAEGGLKGLRQLHKIMSSLKFFNIPFDNDIKKSIVNVTSDSIGKGRKALDEDSEKNIERLISSTLKSNRYL